MAAKVEADAVAGPSLSQYINLSNYVYTSGAVPLNPALATNLDLAPLTYGGKIVSELDTQAGFYGEAFVTTGTASPQLIVAFQGTNTNPPSAAYAAAQIADDTAIYDGYQAASFRVALGFTRLAMADASKLGISSSNDYITGHSLGGADAEFVASRLGLGGVAFAAPGIVGGSRARAAGLTNYVDQGDPVGNYASNAPDYLGSIVKSSAIQHRGSTILIGASSNTTLLTAARAAYTYGGFPGRLAAAGLLADAADQYHPLAHYAQDLGQTLYARDYTSGSDTGFGAASATSGLTFAKLATAAPVAPAATAPAHAPAVELLAANCYAEGTLIRTPRGDVAIERLAVGDEVVTASGAHRPIRWLGHRRVDCARHRRPDEVRPVRIAAHAFGPGRPARNLVVSPGHAILVDVLGEVFVPAAALIDGASVTREAVAAVTYWHLELDTHDVVLAENLPAESFLADGGVGAFARDGVVALHAPLDPDAIHARFCRPFVDCGALVDAVRARLAAIRGAATPRRRHARDARVPC